MQVSGPKMVRVVWVSDCSTRDEGMSSAKGMA